MPPERTAQGDGPPEMVLKPVGIVRSTIIKTPRLRAAGRGDIGLSPDSGAALGQAHEDLERASEIMVYEEFEELLDGIEDFSHLLVLYWAHLVPPEARNLKKVHPIGRKEFPLKGIFATCSPARPNPVLVNAVHLLERNANLLKVQGLEAADGSPLIDIKPYLPSYYGAQNVRLPEWMDRIVRMYNPG